MTARIGICGIETVTASGLVWVCVAAPHDSEKQRSNQRDSRGYWPRHMRHYFQPKYPWRT